MGTNMNWQARLPSISSATNMRHTMPQGEGKRHHDWGKRDRACDDWFEGGGQCRRSGKENVFRRSSTGNRRSQLRLAKKGGQVHIPQQSTNGPVPFYLSEVILYACRGFRLFRGLPVGQTPPPG
jgi:hypothetical protein